MFRVLTVLTCMVTAAFAEDSVAAITPQQDLTARVDIFGNNYVEAGVAYINGVITPGTVVWFDSVVRDVHQLVLNASGDNFENGTDLAFLVKIYEVETLVKERCVGACVWAFVAGRERHVYENAYLRLDVKPEEASIIADYMTNLWFDEQNMLSIASDFHEMGIPFAFGRKEPMTWDDAESANIIDEVHRSVTDAQ